MNAESIKGMRKRPTPADTTGAGSNVAQLMKALDTSKPFIDNAAVTSPETPKAEEGSGDKKYPWDGIDDAVVKSKNYNVVMPATVHEKLKFLSQRMPGGPSIRTQMLEALDAYFEKHLQNYM